MPKLEKFISETLASLTTSIGLHGNLESREGLPEIFERIPEWLGLVRKILKSAQKKVKKGGLDDGNNDVVKGVKNSKRHAGVIESILRTVCTPSDMPFEERYKAAVKKLGGEDAACAALHSLLKAISNLAEDAELETSEEDLDALSSALDEISRMLPEAKGSDAKFQHFGNGDQVNNTGSGRSFLNKGNGRLYHAQTMTFGGS